MTLRGVKSLSGLLGSSLRRVVEREKRSMLERSHWPRIFKREVTDKSTTAHHNDDQVFAVSCYRGVKPRTRLSID